MYKVVTINGWTDQEKNKEGEETNFFEHPELDNLLNDGFTISDKIVIEKSGNQNLSSYAVMFILHKREKK